MALNPDAVGRTAEPRERSWGDREVMLYALGIGAGADDPLGSDLRFTTENSKDVTLQVLPTFAVLLGQGPLGVDVGEYDPAMLVHGEQEIELHGPLPVEGRVRTQLRVAGMHDKGKAAVVALEVTATDQAADKPLFTSRMTLFIRGAGGFGGDHGDPSRAPQEIPEREPDAAVTYTTGTDQALLYRLSGDRNPLHSDPAFAARAGFDRPILHGLCTYGYTGRALLAARCDDDPARFGGMAGRFSRPVFPGDTLTVKIWDLDDGAAAFRTENQNGDTVLDRGRFTPAR
jgi:acyl dehydratase